MDEITDTQRAYYNEFCKTQHEQDQNCMDQKIGAWSFGDNPKMADELLEYVLKGEKTATSSLKQTYIHYNLPFPIKGERNILLDSENKPRCIIENVDVTIKEFSKVDEIFALKEGEGFESLNDWREAHFAFFSRECERMGMSFSDDLLVVCEEFKVIYR